MRSTDGAQGARPPAASAARLWPGLALSFALAIAATLLGQTHWVQARGFSALTIAISFGILLGNTVYPRLGGRPAPGVDFAKRTLLRLGVVLYGLRLTLQDVAHVGLAGVGIDAVIVVSTFMLATIAGRWLAVERATAMLIGAGASICGAAAVMATDPVVRARTDQVTVAVATVVLFGTIGIFAYPELYRFNLTHGWLGGGESGFGIYIGSTVHEVAQVIAAARAVGPEAADTAVITKMVRVMMLAPFLIGVARWLGEQRGEASDRPEASATSAPSAIPWFAVAFIGVVCFNSLGLLPRPVIDALIIADTALLATAMAALGLTTQAAAFRRAGLRPIALAFVLFAWLVIGGGLINAAAGRLAG